MAWIVGLVVVLAAGMARRTRRAESRARAAWILLLEALTWAADERAAKETAIGLLNEAVRLRQAELQLLRAELEALKHEYGRVAQLYREARGIAAAAPAPERVH